MIAGSPESTLSRLEGVVKATPPDVAVQAIMSPNVGVARSPFTQPETYTDPDLATDHA
jgi:hypothetical protein